MHSLPFARSFTCSSSEVCRGGKVCRRRLASWPGTPFKAILSERQEEKAESNSTARLSITDALRVSSTVLLRSSDKVTPCLMSSPGITSKCYSEELPLRLQSEAAGQDHRQISFPLQ